MMRRSIQNLGLNSLDPCSILNRDNCKGYAPVGCLRVPNGYHFLTGVSFFQYFENNDIHLTFGDKFDSVVFLYALYEDGSEVPSTLLCVDEPVFKSYGLSADITAVVPPTIGQFARFKTDEFLQNNRDIHQESAIENTATFKLSASRFVNYLAQRKNDSDFEDIFSSPPAIADDNLPSFQSEDLLIVDGANLEDDSKSKKKKEKSEKKKRDQEIDWAYNNHPTPRKRNAVVKFTIGAEPPKARVPKVHIDMNQLEHELTELEDSNRTNKKSSKRKKETKPKLPKKPRAQKAKQPNNLTPLRTPPTSDTQIQQDRASLTAATAVTQNQQGLGRLIEWTPQLKDEREEREYLRRQSLLDMDVENKRASSAFDLAERANRMA
jgi:hypothetical protein